MERKVRAYLSAIGKRGGSRIRRVLDPDAAKTMVRQARGLYRRFHSACFWSFDPAYIIGPLDIAWVAEQLRKHGGRDAWDRASRLCR